MGASRTLVTCTYDWTQLTDENRFPRAQATTADRLRASLETLHETIIPGNRTLSRQTCPKLLAFSAAF